jgi:hypothetical protein
MKVRPRFVIIILCALCMSIAARGADAVRKHLYVCRSPVLAFDFWSSLQEMQRKGVTMTPKIAQEVCNRMKAGDEP